MDKILHDPKDPKLWELWYIPYNGECRILSISRMVLSAEICSHLLSYVVNHLCSSSLRMKGPYCLCLVQWSHMDRHGLQQIMRDVMMRLVPRASSERRGIDLAKGVAASLNLKPFLNPETPDPRPPPPQDPKVCRGAGAHQVRCD